MPFTPAPLPTRTPWARGGSGDAGASVLRVPAGAIASSNEEREAAGGPTLLQIQAQQEGGEEARRKLSELCARGYPADIAAQALLKSAGDIEAAEAEARRMLNIHPATVEMDARAWHWAPSKQAQVLRPPANRELQSTSSVCVAGMESNGGSRSGSANPPPGGSGSVDATGCYASAAQDPVSPATQQQWRGGGGGRGMQSPRAGTGSPRLRSPAAEPSPWRIPDETALACSRQPGRASSEDATPLAWPALGDVSPSALSPTSPPPVQPKALSPTSPPPPVQPKVLMRAPNTTPPLSPSCALAGAQCTAQRRRDCAPTASAARSHQPTHGAVPAYPPPLALPMSYATATGAEHKKPHAERTALATPPRSMVDKVAEIKRELAMPPELPMASAVKKANAAMGLEPSGTLPTQVQKLLEAMGLSAI